MRKQSISQALEHFQEALCVRWLFLCPFFSPGILTGTSSASGSAWVTCPHPNALSANSLQQWQCRSLHDLAGTHGTPEFSRSALPTNADRKRTTKHFAVLFINLISAKKMQTFCKCKLFSWPIILLTYLVILGKVIFKSKYFFHDPILFSL